MEREEEEEEKRKRTAGLLTVLFFTGALAAGFFPPFGNVRSGGTLDAVRLRWTTFLFCAAPGRGHAGAGAALRRAARAGGAARRENGRADEREESARRKVLERRGMVSCGGLARQASRRLSVSRSVSQSGNLQATT
jgi:hypothetical protein